MAQKLFNNQAHAAPKEFDAVAAAVATSPVWVSATAAGTPITNVKQSTFSANNLYWLNATNNKVVHSMDFIVTFKTGSPLTTQRQSFIFPGGGYGGTVTTPFGVPFWGGNPILGPAVLTVLADGVPLGSYNFTVVP